MLTVVFGGLAAVLALFRLAAWGVDRIVERRIARERQARAACRDLRRMAAAVNRRWVRELTAAARER